MTQDEYEWVRIVQVALEVVLYIAVYFTFGLGAMFCLSIWTLVGSLQKARDKYENNC